MRVAFPTPSLPSPFPPTRSSISNRSTQRRGAAPSPQSRPSPRRPSPCSCSSPCPRSSSSPSPSRSRHTRGHGLARLPPIQPHKTPKHRTDCRGDMTIPTCLNNTSPYQLPPSSVSTRHTFPITPVLRRPLPVERSVSTPRSWNHWPGAHKNPEHRISPKLPSTPNALQHLSRSEQGRKSRSAMTPPPATTHRVPPSLPEPKYYEIFVLDIPEAPPHEGCPSRGANIAIVQH